MGISVKIGIIFTLIGSWIKVFINTFFEIVIIGQAFIAFGTPFIINSKTMVASYWFKPDDWGSVTMLVSFLTIVNSMISLIAPGLWFNKYDLKFDA